MRRFLMPQKTAERTSLNLPSLPNNLKIQRTNRKSQRRSQLPRRNLRTNRQRRN